VLIVEIGPIDFGGWHFDCRKCGWSADIIRTRSPGQ
jgi:hypothetical protein